MTLSQASATLTPAQTVSLGATTKDASGNTLTGRIVTWASNAVAVATVDATGVVTAAAVGTAIVTATSEGHNASATITVAAVVVPVASVTLDITSASVQVGGTTALTATLKDAAGTILVGRAVSWTTSNAAIATALNGVVTGVSPGGPVTITALSEGKSATAQITVTTVPVNTVTVSPPNNAVTVGGTTTFTAVTKDASGTTLTGRVVVWSSSNSAIASVLNGVVTGVSAGGPVVITATSEGKSGAAAVTVNVPMATWTESDGLRLGGSLPVYFFRFAVGPDGSAVSTDGSSHLYERSPAGVWQQTVFSAPGLTTIWGVFVDAGGTRWAVGDNGTIARRGAAGWVQEVSGTTQPIYSISILPNGTGLAVGGGGTVLSRSALGVWSQIPGPAFQAALVSVTITASNFAMALGSNGTGGGGVFRWNGSTWTTLPVPPTVSTYTPAQLVVGGPNEVYVAGYDGPDTDHFRFIVAEWNGTSWSIPVTDQAAQSVFVGGLDRCSDGTVYASTQYGRIYRRRSGTWSVFSPAGETTNTGNGLQCDSDNSLMVFGQNDLVMRNRLGIWTTERWRPNVLSVSLGPNGNAFALSLEGVARFDGSQWTRMGVVPWAPTNLTFYFEGSIWTDGTTAVVADLTAGRYQSGAWTWGATQNVGRFAIWGPSASLLFADGGFGALSTYSGGNWVTTPLPQNLSDQITHIHGVANYAVATGADAFFQWNGATWSKMPSPAAFVGGPVWVFSSTNVVSVHAGVMYRWNGTQWSSAPMATGNVGGDADCLIARSPTEMYAFGSSKRILGYDGISWRQLGTTSQVITSCAWAGNTGIAVGKDGLVLFGVPSSSARFRMR